MEPMGGNPAGLVAALRDGTFPRRDWDHRAHLAACWSIHREHPGADRRGALLTDRCADVPRGVLLTDPSADALVEAVKVVEVVDVVRVLISAYNLRTAPPGSPSGCHETVTRYFVEAVGRVGAHTVDALVAHPWCHVDAPARHWSRDLLWSDVARARWVEPDLAQLPWTVRPAAPARRTDPPTRSTDRPAAPDRPADRRRPRSDR